MIDLLSLPRQSVVDYGHIKSKKIGTGLPINSLPGWEIIPLNSKLPMLKCPGNQVIFTKDKIGQSLLSRLKHDFDTSFQDKIPEYNPLHDLNLRNFYRNENNLKRLRENGEITDQNDVICNLKDFNEHRQQIHKSYIYYLMAMRKKADFEMQDRKLINNAEVITDYDYDNLNLRSQSFHEILLKRRAMDVEMAKKRQQAVEKKEEQIRRIKEKKALQWEELQKKRVLHDMHIKQHQEARDEFFRKRLIQVKKMYQIKKFRYLRALRILHEKQQQKYSAKVVERWEQRLAKRVEYQRYIAGLLVQREQQKIQNVENHKQRYKEEWEKIQMEIKQRKLDNLNSKKRKKPKILRRPSVDYIYGNANMSTEMDDDFSDSEIPLNKTNRTCKKDNAINFSEIAGSKEPVNICELQQLFENMMEYDMCDALYKLMEIQTDPKLPFDRQDPSYKLANFIINNVVDSYNKDLTNDKSVVHMVVERLLKVFDMVLTDVLARGRQLILHIQTGKKQGSGGPVERVSLVTFSRNSSFAGVSSYDINPNIDLRRTSARKPTPSGSLASILAAEPTIPSEAIKLPVLSRADAVFIEHLIVKFKRELGVSTAKIIYEGIKLYFKGTPKRVRKELLAIDKKYLAKTGALGLLRFNICNLDFYSAVRLCSSALGAEGMWSLYRQVLRPDRDSRGIKKHKRFQKDWVCLMFDEKVKEEYCCAPPDPAEGLIGNPIK